MPEFFLFGAVHSRDVARELHSRLDSICEARRPGDPPLTRLSVSESVYKLHSTLGGSQGSSAVVGDFSELRVVEDRVRQTTCLRRLGRASGAAAAAAAEKVNAHAVTESVVAAGSDARQLVTLMGFGFDFRVCLEGINGFIRFNRELLVEVNMCRLCDRPEPFAAGAGDERGRQQYSVDWLLGQSAFPAPSPPPLTGAPIADGDDDNDDNDGPFLVRLRTTGRDDQRALHTKALLFAADQLLPLIEFAVIDRQSLENARHQAKKEAAI